MSYDDYWSFKKNKVSNEVILRNEFDFDEVAIQHFLSNWMKCIEAPEFLAYDKKLPGAKDALVRLSKYAELHICTARQLRQSAVNQLDRLGLLPYFKTVMVTGQSQRKDELIATSLSRLSPKDWMIGDTGKDIQVGHSLGIKTCGVLSGFLNEKSLKPYKPDIILPSIVDFTLCKLTNN
jgi:phosphoglycolate phosphatase